MTIELTNGKFDDFVKKGIVLVDFHADWCMPCVMMGPIVEDMSKKFKGKLKVGKVNVEDNQKLAQKHNILSIPTFLIFKDGKIIEQFVGAVSEEELENKMKKYVK